MTKRMAVFMSTRHKTPTLPTMLLQQFDTRDGHATVDRFAHVVDGEQGDLHSGQVLSEINNLHPQAFSLFPIFCWFGGTKWDRNCLAISLH